MIKDKPNIILINIDGLRYDHVGLHGHVPSITPSIDQIFARGLRLSKMFTHGCPTQFASPSIFTSSLPLDCGGYDFGIKNRQNSFVECLREAGYWTVGYALSGPLTNFYAYNRGFEEYYHLQDLSVFLTALWTSYVNHYNRRFDDGEITDAECLGVLTPLIGQAIETLIGLCDEKLSEVRADGIHRSRHFLNQNYASAARYMAGQKKVFSSDPDTYIRTRILGKSWREAFPILGASREKKWLQVACRRATVALTKWNFQFRPPLSKAPDGQIVDQICRAVDRLDDRPHFIWANLMSLHDGQYSPHRVMLPPLHRRAFWKIIREGKNYRGKRHYDLALAYVDAQIGRLISFLRRRDKLENTLLVIISDHGMNANWPRPDIHHVGEFYDEFSHVPVVFAHRDIAKGCIDSLHGMIDFAPTLLDLLGISSPPDFLGTTARESGKRHQPYVLMENMGRGPCDFSSKSIRLAFRTDKEKFIFREQGQSFGGDCLIEAAFDLDKDPLEQTDISADTAYKQKIQEFHERALERCRDIRRQAAIQYHD